ncbi:MAG: hypothetical protein AAB215_05235 [Planctomycetota bacterium]
MGLGISAIGRGRKRLVLSRPSAAALLERIEAFSTSLPAEPWHCLERISREDEKLLVHLHPAEEAVYMEPAAGGAIRCTAKTSSAGPGYHRYLVEFLEALGRSARIEWEWKDAEGEPGDETGYAEHRDFARLQREMLAWLRALAGQVSDEKFAADFDGCLAISMPMGCSLAGESRFAMTPLGFRDREWFRQATETPPEFAMPYGEEHFPWWGEGEDASFYRNTALALLWCECPWHRPADDREKALLRQIDRCLARAHSLDPKGDLPWAEWKEVLDLLGDSKGAGRLAARIPAGAPPASIGYRRRLMRRRLTGPWTVALAGSFYEELQDEGRTVCYWLGNRTVRGSSLSMTPKKGAKPSPIAPDDEDRAENVEIVPFEKGDVTGFAGLQKATEEGREPYWLLQGKVGTATEMAIVSVCFDDFRDRDWAISTFLSVEKDAKGSRG